MFLSKDNLGNPTHPYLIRWVCDFKFFSLRIHHWRGSDDLRHPHDHPWNFWSILLWGQLSDRAPADGESYKNGYVDTPRRRWRPEYFFACHRHSVVLHSRSAWTLPLTGPAYRAWGFWVPLKGGKHQGKVRFRRRNKYFRIFGHH